jgi:hypothetical protein
MARIGAKRNACRILVRKPEEEDSFEDLSADTTTVLKWV